MAEKTEEPTQKKLDDARKEGNLMHSEEVVQWATFCCVLIYFFIAGSWMFQKLMEVMQFPALLVNTRETFEQQLLELKVFFWPIFLLILPLLMTQIIASIFGNILQKGVNVILKSITPSFKSLNVANNVKEIFSIKGVVKLLQSTGKTLLLIAIGCWVGWVVMPDVFRLTGREHQIIFPVISDALRLLCIAIAVCLLPIAGLDLMWQRYQYIKKLKMERREVIQEHKDLNGNPEIKAKRREYHEEILSDTTKERVKQSSVVVTNPTHFAVGLHYQPGETPLPTITLCERGERAWQIRLYAQANHIPVVENVSVARKLYYQSVPGDCIPSEVIDEVAEILAALLSLNTPSSPSVQAPDKDI